MNQADDYDRRTIELLEESYLAAEARGDVAGGSGSGGGLARWERKRALAEAFDRDGAWLDIGCANGLLMETLTRWTAEASVLIEPSGVDLPARIADAARRRLGALGEPSMGPLRLRRKLVVI